MISSESAAFSSSNYDLERDLHPGEAIFISDDGEMHTKICSDNTTLTPCLFEYVYFARPDSVIDGVSVYQARQNMGVKLAEKIKKHIPDEDIDVVIPIPESSITSGTKVAECLNKEVIYGFVKNRYIGRTFIMPEQDMRRRSVRRKLNPINDEFKNKNVLLVDDSIVRGTTMKEIVAMCYKSGAKKVSVASSSSEVKFPNVYGIDMPAKSELIASNRSLEEIKEFIGCDNLVYQDLSDLIDSVTELNSELDDVEKSIFTGVYPTNITDGYLENLEKKRQAINS